MNSQVTLPNRSSSTSYTRLVIAVGTFPKNAWAIPPAMQASVSLSPPRAIALRTASSKLSDSRNARIAWGTDFWQET
jgi:hypothetical protein